MKKISMCILTLLCSLLIGCNNSISADEITTFEEEVNGNIIIIDGTEYDIISSYIISNKYENQNLVEEFIDFQDNSNSKFVYIYEGKLLVQETNYQNDELIYNKFYSYENGKEVSTKQVAVSGETAQYSKTAYEGNHVETGFYESDDNLSSIESVELSDDGKIIEKKTIIPDTDIMIEYKYQYINNNVVCVNVYMGEETFGRIYYTYNNLNHLISEYEIVYGKNNSRLIAKYYENEYNEDLELVQQVVYNVNSEIKEENIRE
ncbi:hypothetical protein EZV73_03895 [Acidaminobacter sp. JC074]|uniref:hypothetical protein n=1 Tax=Acidaminobacter sp. JC074 TaxID=2530199 RepID=UPI001F0F7F48|nr:hypothetical protein [Acidaminobacter sp. JC074]MCH4886693.1 hypothetical protein [Acidaminobacter sp. JC074]